MGETRERRVEHIAKLTYRLTDFIRDRTSFEVQTPTAHDFSDFGHRRQCLLVTFKRSGEAVPSPMNFGLEDGKLYIRTPDHSAKVKRIRNNPHVTLVPSNIRGKPTGKAVSAIARILPTSEIAAADAVIAANWSATMKLFERGYVDSTADQFDLPQAYVEFTAQPPIP